MGPSCTPAQVGTYTQAWHAARYDVWSMADREDIFDLDDSQEDQVDTDAEAQDAADEAPQDAGTPEADATPVEDEQVVAVVLDPDFTVQVTDEDGKSSPRQPDQVTVKVAGAPDTVVTSEPQEVPASVAAALNDSPAVKVVAD